VLTVKEMHHFGRGPLEKVLGSDVLVTRASEHLSLEHIPLAVLPG
jgi:hypothetical protein